MGVDLGPDVLGSAAQVVTSPRRPRQPPNLSSVGTGIAGPGDPPSPATPPRWRSRGAVGNGADGSAPCAHGGRHGEALSEGGRPRRPPGATQRRPSTRRHSASLRGGRDQHDGAALPRLSGLALAGSGDLPDTITGSARRLADATTG